jgi:hypothetical protein
MATIRLDVMIEFFATSDEVAEWALLWLRERHLNNLLVRRRPFAVMKGTNWNDIGQVKELLPQFDQLLLGLEPLDSAGRTATEVASLNPDRLDVELPRLTSKGLRAAGIGSVTQDTEALKTWRAVAKDVLDRTKAGMWIVNFSIPAKRLYPKLRYSPGAAAAEDRGVRLLTFAAETPVFVTEPDLDVV